MPETLTVSLTRPIAGLRVVDAAGHTFPAGNGSGIRMVQGAGEQLAAEQLRRLQELEQQEKNLTQLCETISSITTKLNDLYQETIAQNRSDIAKLAVEIARKILQWKTNSGDYDMRAVVEEALKQAPTRQDLVVKVNPEDLPRCQQLQQEQSEGQFAELDLVADWGVAQADCLIETPKGIVRSFVEEQLGRIAEALEKAH
ncbi:MAG: FliH/SctL family protein [Planctomycetota bacterium]|jgi:flagellar biosynthesis/type III secretory pathway protein FliH